MSARGPRVVAGEAGGLRLVAPSGRRTRPTTDRVKEALFASLGPSRLEGASVLDGFAGSGALGIEALSRGAAHALLVDRATEAIAAIRTNLRATGLTARATVRRGALASVLADPPGAPFDLVLLDPPYQLTSTELGRVLAGLEVPGRLRSHATVTVARATADGPPELPDGWDVSWQRAYGGTLVVVAVPPEASSKE